MLKEKDLTLSALGQDAAAQAGRLAGADWLLSGEYVFLGSDVLLTLSLTEAATAKRVVFRDRWPNENLLLDKLTPESHTLRVHLNSSFGVVKLPEVSFGDWETSFEVEADKRATLRDLTRHFNETLYRLIELGGDSLKASRVLQSFEHLR